LCVVAGFSRPFAVRLQADTTYSRKTMQRKKVPAKRLIADYLQLGNAAEEEGADETAHSRAADPSSFRSCSTVMIRSRAAGLTGTSGKR